MTSVTPQSTIPTLHHLSSSQSFRVLWALEELKAANQTQYTLKKYQREKSVAPASLKQIHPLGKSPILTIDPAFPSATTTTNATKPLRTLIESRLILQFISENYANGLWTPKSAQSLDRDLFFQEYANSTLRSKVDFTMIFDIIPSQLPFFIRPLGAALCWPIVKHMKSELPPVFQILEDALTSEEQGEEGKRWFAGEKIGLADFNVSWSVDVADARGYLDKQRFPRLAEWHQRVRGREAYRRALEIGGAYDLGNFK